MNPIDKMKAAAKEGGRRSRRLRVSPDRLHRTWYGLPASIRVIVCWMLVVGRVS